MHQVRFVVACEDGHLSDFPWNEWAHQSASPDCDGLHLHLQSSGSTSLSALRVYCKKCNTKPRSLEGTTQVDDDSSFLSQNLEKGHVFVCKGHSPWLGNHHTNNCQKPIRAALRGAANIYFADMVSSLLLPVGENTNQELIDLISTTESIWDAVTQASKYCSDSTVIASNLHKEFSSLQDYSVSDTSSALTTIFTQDENGTDVDADNEVLYRFEERKRLMHVVERNQLKVEPIDIQNYEPWFSDAFSDISLVHRLTETRALSGFYRLSPSSNMERSERVAQLRKTPAPENHLWLPACQVYGEGIYLELNAQQIQKWLIRNQIFIQKRVATLQKSMNHSFRQFHQALTPEYVLLHTLAHLVINQLVFECGYSSASLRERLYYPDPEQEIQMAGILIYTAAGDSEGSLGGLVNMGRPEHLERIISKALENARWCSSDPVCMEAAEHGGQGPDSLNLAACHACSLLPETSCEAFNCLLDRGLLVGQQDNFHAGYFSNKLT